MAIAKGKFPAEETRGALGRIDRTIGRDKGFSLGIQKSRHSMKLISKKQSTRGGSEARHERSRVYCDCDAQYKLLGETKPLYLTPYYREAHDLDVWALTNYQTWMKLCLPEIQEKVVFAEFCWLSRYQIRNTDSAPWENKIVRLISIPTKRSDGKDLRVFRMDSSWYIMQELEHKIDATGSTEIKIPYLDSDVYFYADCYSFSDVAHYEGW